MIIYSLEPLTLTTPIGVNVARIALNALAPGIGAISNRLIVGALSFGMGAKVNRLNCGLLTMSGGAQLIELEQAVLLRPIAPSVRIASLYFKTENISLREVFNKTGERSLRELVKRESYE